MNTTWERFAGDEERFAVRIALRRDPSPDFEDPDVSASWGSLQLWIEGKNVCAHTDQGETLESVHWHLLPMLEWLVDHWDSAFHEERLPIGVRAAGAVDSLQETIVPSRALSPEQAEAWEEEWYAWWSRHAFRAARSGGPLPDLVLRRWRDRVEFSWGDAPFAGDGGLRFLAGTGMSRVDPAEIGLPLIEVLTAVTHQLVEIRPSTRLIALSEMVATLQDPARLPGRVAWMAGLRSAGESVRESWGRVEEVFADAPGAAREAALGIAERAGIVQGSCQAALLFGAVAPDISADDVVRLARLLVEQYEPASESPELCALTESRPVPIHVRPWQDGYDCAEEVREALAFADDVRVDLDALFERLRVEQRQLELDDENIRGVAIASPDHRPTVVINERSFHAKWPRARRFTLAHEFCHLLFDRSEGQRLAVATGPWAPLEVEQRANAFAAAFLMAPQGIRAYAERSEDALDTREGVMRTAEHFGVTEVATIEHLRNLGFISDADRANLRAWIAARLQS